MWNLFKGVHKSEAPERSASYDARLPDGTVIDPSEVSYMVSMFQSVLQESNEEEARRCLSRHGWDVQSAMKDALGQEPERQLFDGRPLHAVSAEDEATADVQPQQRAANKHAAGEPTDDDADDSFEKDFVDRFIRSAEFAAAQYSGETAASTRKLSANSTDALLGELERDPDSSVAFWEDRGGPRSSQKATEESTLLRLHPRRQLRAAHPSEKRHRLASALLASRRHWCAWSGSHTRKVICVIEVRTQDKEGCMQDLVRLLHAATLGAASVWSISSVW